MYVAAPLADAGASASVSHQSRSLAGQQLALAQAPPHARKTGPSADVIVFNRAWLHNWDGRRAEQRLDHRAPPSLRLRLQNIWFLASRR